MRIKLSDKKRTCIVCGQPFYISKRYRKEVRKYHRHDPIHCPVCLEYRWKTERIRKRQERRYSKNLRGRLNHE